MKYAGNLLLGGLVFALICNFTDLRIILSRAWLRAFDPSIFEIYTTPRPLVFAGSSLMADPILDGDTLYICGGYSQTYDSELISFKTNGEMNWKRKVNGCNYFKANKDWLIVGDTYQKQRTGSKGDKAFKYIDRVTSLSKQNRDVTVFDTALFQNLDEAYLFLFDLEKERYYKYDFASMKTQTVNADEIPSYRTFADNQIKCSMSLDEEVEGFAPLRCENTLTQQIYSPGTASLRHLVKIIDGKIYWYGPDRKPRRFDPATKQSLIFDLDITFGNLHAIDGRFVYASDKRELIVLSSDGAKIWTKTFPAQVVGVEQDARNLYVTDNSGSVYFVTKPKTLR